MPDKSLSLQDQFLNSIRRSKSPVTVFLVKGVKLQGIVTWFDPFSLLLRRDGNAQLVYKHAISTIMPGHPPADLKFSNGEGGNGKKPMLQDLFLSAASREHEPMTVFLVNGVMLQGSVAGYDQFSLVLERAGQVQLVYKHAISTMQPGHPLNLAGESQAEDEA
jgi:host factor-I protein